MTYSTIMCKVVYILFIGFGLFGIVYPNGIVNNMTDNYNVVDLMQGWGIYACSIGLLLLFPTYTYWILALCFIASIIWHVYLIKKNGYTQHHKEAIIINSFVLLVALCLIINEQI